jgi:hypothetical protein
MDSSAMKSCHVIGNNLAVLSKPFTRGWKHTQFLKYLFFAEYEVLDEVLQRCKPRCNIPLWNLPQLTEYKDFVLSLFFFPSE